jgi:hypothetical protein
MLYKGLKQRKKTPLARTEREKFLWDMIMENWINFYGNELKWLRNFRKD